MGNIRVYDIVLGGEVTRNIEAHDSQVLSLDFSGSKPGKARGALSPFAGEVQVDTELDTEF